MHHQEVTMTTKYSFKILIICILAVFFTEKSYAQATVTVQQDDRIPTLLNLKKSLEKDNKLTDGFTIQLYYGNLSKANSILSSYRNKYGEWPASIEYETPNYKVWVGNFSDRIEADRALIEVHRHFPAAFILKPGKNKKDN